MLSGVACAPRICSACRRGLAQRSAITTGFRSLQQTDRFRQRPYSSKPMDKAQVEALISGEISGKEAKRLFQKQKQLEKREEKRAMQDLPDWGLTKTKIDAPVLKPAEPQDREKSQYDFIKAALSGELQRMEESKERSAEDSIEEALSETPKTPKWPVFAKGLEEVMDDDWTTPDLDANTKNEGRTAAKSSPTSEAESALDSMYDFEDEVTGRQERAPKERRRRPRSEDDSELRVEIPTHLEQPIAPRKRFRHNLLRDAELNVSALGKPASAIIINNPNEMRRARKTAKVLEEKSLEANMRLDWERFMSKDLEDEVVSSEEVCENIDELRPQDTNIIRMKDFDNLTQQLTAGFTTIQLRDYFRHHNTGSDVGEKDMLDYSWITKQVPWTPLKTLPSDSYSPKQMYAQRILSLKWNIEIQDYVDDLGRAFVWVDPELFPLITQGSSPLINTLRDEFLIDAANERMTTTSTECRINITARKPSTYAIIDRLDEAFRRLQRKKMSVGQFLTVNPSQSELQELARITNTSIKSLGSGNGAEIEVSWLSESPATEILPPQERIETPADIVFRLLTPRQQRDASDTLDVVLPQKAKASEVDAKGQFVDFRRETKSMAWRDKLWNWSRRVQPVSADTESQSVSLKLSDSVALPEHKSVKGDEATSVTTATFGHILHSETDIPFAKLAKQRRILCPIIPHPAAFSSLKADNDEPLTQETAIILNFAPRIDREAGLGKGPSIQLRLPVSADSDLSNFALPENATFNAILPRYTKDILLPDQSIDIRFADHRSVPLDISQSSLKDFLAISEFNLLAGRLRTPSQVTFSIPEKMLSAKPPTNLKSSTNANVPYIFYGLEIHQTVEMHWRQHTLRYSSIEAGQHGGQRQELTLKAGRSDKPVAFKGATRKSFLQCVEDLAAGNVFSWDEGYKAMKERRFEDYSYDLPGEELGEDILVEPAFLDGFVNESRVRKRNEVDIEEGEIMDEELDDVFDNDDGDGGLSKREIMDLERDIDELLNLGAYENEDADNASLLRESREDRDMKDRDVENHDMEDLNIEDLNMDDTAPRTASEDEADKALFKSLADLLDENGMSSPSKNKELPISSEDATTTVPETSATPESEAPEKQGEATRNELEDKSQDTTTLSAAQGEVSSETEVQDKSEDATTTEPPTKDNNGVP